MISVKDLTEVAYFNIGNTEYYEGYHIKGNTWNGWAMPYFEKRIADLITHNFSTRDFQIVYDKYTDCYICKTIENDKVSQIDVVEKKIINTIDGEKQVYDFGSIGWTWDAYTLDEAKEKYNANIIKNNNIEKEDTINMDY